MSITDNMSSLRRINKEIKDMREEALNDNANLIFSVAPDEDNIYNWSGYIFGPHESPYQGGSFEIFIAFPQGYPFKPPHIEFRTRIYHPNIGREGNICLDILKDKWSPALTLSKILMSISSLLTDPNPDDPLDISSANVYKRDINKFNYTAKEWTRNYAML